MFECFYFFFFKQKTAYEIGTGDWSSDVCSSDLPLLKIGRKSKLRPNMVKQNVLYLGITESESGLYFGRELTTWKNVDIRIKR